MPRNGTSHPWTSRPGGLDRPVSDFPNLPRGIARTFTKGRIWAHAAPSRAGPAGLAPSRLGTTAAWSGAGSTGETTLLPWLALAQTSAASGLAVHDRGGPGHAGRRSPRTIRGWPDATVAHRQPEGPGPPLRRPGRRPHRTGAGWPRPSSRRPRTRFGLLEDAGMPYSIAVGNHDTRAVGWNGHGGYGGRAYVDNPECLRRFSAAECTDPCAAATHPGDQRGVQRRQVRQGRRCVRGREDRQPLLDVLRRRQELARPRPGDLAARVGGGLGEPRRRAAPGAQRHRQHPRIHGLAEQHRRQPRQRPDRAAAALGRVHLAAPEHLDGALRARREGRDARRHRSRRQQGRHLPPDLPQDGPGQPGAARDDLPRRQSHRHRDLRAADRLRTSRPRPRP